MTSQSLHRELIRGNRYMTIDASQPLHRYITAVDWHNNRYVTAVTRQPFTSYITTVSPHSKTVTSQQLNHNGYIITVTSQPLHHPNRYITTVTRLERSAVCTPSETFDKSSRRPIVSRKSQPTDTTQLPGQPIRAWAVQLQLRER